MLNEFVQRFAKQLNDLDSPFSHAEDKGIMRVLARLLVSEPGRALFFARTDDGLKSNESTDDGWGFRRRLFGLKAAGKAAGDESDESNDRRGGRVINVKIVKEGDHVKIEDPQTETSVTVVWEGKKPAHSGKGAVTFSGGQHADIDAKLKLEVLEGGQKREFAFENPAVCRIDSQARNAKRLDAFRTLVAPRPDGRSIFDTHLSSQQDRKDMLLSDSGIADEVGELMISDPIIKAQYLWHVNVIPLFTEARIRRSFNMIRTANERVRKELLKQGGGGTSRDTTLASLKLYGELLGLLLCLATLAGEADPDKVATNVEDALNQIERSKEQQNFLLMDGVLSEMRARSKAPNAREAFKGFEVKMLGKVLQMGANTLEKLSDIKGKSRDMCMTALTTLMKGFIEKEPPKKWSSMFEDAAENAYQVKYMFREKLEKAQELFTKSADKAPEAKNLIKDLLKDSLTAFGVVGFYDAQKLQEIDFLTQPTELIDQVAQCQVISKRGVDRRSCN